MNKKPQFCENCDLYGNGEGFITEEGICSNGVLIVGEAGGYGEALNGQPFQPNQQAGSILQRVIQEKAKYNRSEFGLTNLIQCQPPRNLLLNQPYEYTSINKCRHYFDKIIEKFRPRVILGLGSLVFHHLVGLQGKNTEITKVRGYVFKCSRYPDILVICSIHPSYIRRGNPHLMSLLTLDFEKANRLAQGRYNDYILDPREDKSLKYILYPTLEDGINFYERCRANPSTIISIDIENPKSAHLDEEDIEVEEIIDNAITQIQFSIEPNSGIAFKWNADTLPIIRMILSLPNPKVGHNIWDYDLVVLKKHGIEVKGEIFDSQWEAHHLNADLPIGLQAVGSWFNFRFPFKHMVGSDFELYGIADADCSLQAHLYLRKQLETRGLWGEFSRESNRYTGYYGLVHHLKPILIRTSERGLPINVEKQEAFKKEIEIRQIEIEEILREIVPIELVNYHPAKGYVREPKEVKGITQRLMVELNELPSEEVVEQVAAKQGIIKRIFDVDISPKDWDGAMFGKAIRWCKIEYFNPNSPDQVSNLIKHNGHEAMARKLAIKIAKDERNKEENESSSKNNVSTSKNVLKALNLKTGQEVYSYIVEYKELTKMVGSFIDGWKPGADGRVHPQFTFRPATLQLSARNPNSQQFPVHTTLASKMQETIEAEEGNIFCAFDYRGYHALMLGYLSGDENYMRLCKIDIHSYVTAHLVGLEGADCLGFDDEGLKDYLDKVKKDHKDIRNRRAKVTILGIGLGLSENGCYERYRDGFDPSPEEAMIGKRKKYEGEALAKLVSSMGRRRVKDLYDLLRSLFPRVFKYQSQVIVEADKGFYQIKYGARRWFNAASEVKYDRYGNVISRTKGIEAEEAIAFPVQANAHCHLREGILLLEEKGYLDKYRFVNSIHDSLVFEPKQEDVEGCIRDVRPILERVSTTLEGFSCAVDIKSGKSIATLREVEI